MAKEGTVYIVAHMEVNAPFRKSRYSNDFNRILRPGCQPTKRHPWQEKIMGDSESGRWVKIEWKMALPESGDVPVWVSVAKLEHEWQRSKNEYIGSGGDSAMPGKYENFEKWIISARHVDMPEVCVVEGFVRFNNGRHRFAWLRDHGMTALQVSVQPIDVTTFETKFGSQDQTSQWLKS